MMMMAGWIGGSRRNCLFIWLTVLEEIRNYKKLLQAIQVHGKDSEVAFYLIEPIEKMK